MRVTGVTEKGEGRILAIMAELGKEHAQLLQDRLAQGSETDRLTIATAVLVCDRRYGVEGVRTWLESK